MLFMYFTEREIERERQREEKREEARLGMYVTRV